MAELNEKLIACVLEHIEQHPEEYDQSLWAHVEDQEQDGNYCGTTACVAGWACLLSTPVEKWREPHNYGYYYHEGARLLGLDVTEASMLFGGAEGDSPEANVVIIKGRLDYIRKRRASLKVLMVNGQE
jgi:hypothetical protein